MSALAGPPGQSIKQDWMRMPSDFFAPMTFGELKVGDKFISMPMPGDNAGHGGFRGPHYIYEKISDNSRKSDPRSRLLDGGSAKSSAGAVMECHNFMTVIQVL